jgi:DNA (cytosine-5)-methyltransferase 1
MPALQDVLHTASTRPNPERPECRPERELLTAGSLFSGAGLCDLGLSWAGFQHLFFCEIDPFCRSILARHWPGVHIYDDVRGLGGADIPRVDVLCGGFPCQDVSCAGKRAGIKEGTRSGLWHEFRRIISEARPRYVIIENVRGLLSRGIEGVLQSLAGIGYDAEWTVLSAAACGAPHHRERVFIVAYPDSGHNDGECRLLSPLRGILGKIRQPHGPADWLGIRLDRQDRASAPLAYGGRVLCRVDDGRAGRVDKSFWDAVDMPPRVSRISRDKARALIPALKALGNGIVPHQSYAIAACILIAEGLPAPPLPKTF